MIAAAEGDFSLLTIMLLVDGGGRICMVFAFVLRIDQVLSKIDLSLDDGG